MELQVATLCDAAADYGGKLTVMGAFDTIAGRGGAPIVHPQCSLAMRICFRAEDEGVQKFSVAIIDADGKEIVPSFEPQFDVKLPSPDSFFVTRNLVVNMQRLKFPDAGNYAIDIRCDEQVLGRIPLRVMLVDEQGRPASPSNPA
jgi:hypothetical protein